MVRLMGGWRMASFVLAVVFVVVLVVAVSDRENYPPSR